MAFSALLLFHGTPSCLRNVKSLSWYFTSLTRKVSAASDRHNWPGRSRDYSLELPQIQACTLNAPGSSHCGIAVPHTTGWFRGDTLVRHGILGVVPTPRPQRGTPFAPRG